MLLDAVICVYQRIGSLPMQEEIIIDHEYIIDNMEANETYHSARIPPYFTPSPRRRTRPVELILNALGSDGDIELDGDQRCSVSIIQSSL